MEPIPLPPEPTLAAPGTPEKERVFVTRLREGYSLFHPADSRFEGDTLPLDWLRWKQEREAAATGRMLDFIKSRGKNGKT